MLKSVLRSTIVLVMLQAVASSVSAQARTPCPVARAGSIVLYGDIPAQISLGREDLAAFPQVQVTGSPHGGTAATYAGPTIGQVLSRAGLPNGTALRGAEMLRYIVVEAVDGYRAVFALAELDSAFRDPVPILALTRDGNPLDADAAPFQVIVPNEQRHARWVRQVACIRIARDRS